MQDHCATLGGSRRRRVLVVNLDPAAENINYECAIDVRELISVEDVMEELGLGPNGGLIYCMEYLLQNLHWLQEQMEPQGAEGDMQDYWIIDCPGQLELYTHVPIMRTILDRMQHSWGFTPGCMVSVFCIDSTFCCDAQKMISGQLLALSAMISLELPHINVLTKGDLLPERDIEAILDLHSATQLWELEQDRTSIFALPREMATIMRMEEERYGLDLEHDAEEENQEDAAMTNRQRTLEQRRRKRHRLTESICSLLDDYPMVGFVALNVNDEESIDHVLMTVDHAIQYGEDLEVRGAEGDDDMVNPNDGNEEEEADLE
jgi:GPN-loop GTPase